MGSILVFIVWLSCFVVEVVVRFSWCWLFVLVYVVLVCCGGLLGCWNWSGYGNFLLLFWRCWVCSVVWSCFWVVWFFVFFGCKRLCSSGLVFWKFGLVIWCRVWWLVLLGCILNNWKFGFGFLFVCRVV